MDMPRFFGTEKGEAEAPAPTAKVLAYDSLEEFPVVKEAAERLSLLDRERAAAEKEIADRTQRLDSAQAMGESIGSTDMANMLELHEDLSALDRRVRFVSQVRSRAIVNMMQLREQARREAAGTIWPAYETAVRELEEALEVAQAKNDRVAAIYEEASTVIGGTLSNPIPNLTFAPLNRPNRWNESKMEAWLRNLRSYFTRLAA